jgi:hypothetical protein
MKRRHGKENDQPMAQFVKLQGDDLMALADGDHVAVCGTWSAGLNQTLGMKTKGKSFKVRDVDIFTFNSDGKITEHRNVQSLRPC